MIGQGLLDFIRHRNSLIGKQRGTDGKTFNDALISMTKLTEETGELAEQILGAGKLLRSDKQAKISPDGLAEELADMLIVTLLIADTFDVDINAALADKMEKIAKR